MGSHAEMLPPAHQMDRLTRDVLVSYSSGDTTWSQIRERLGIQDFGLVLRRLGEEGLSLPRASADRPTRARGWLRDVLQHAAAR